MIQHNAYMMFLLDTLSRKRTYTPIILSVLFFAIGCDSENANDCVQTDGDSISITLDLPLFSKIQMENDIRVILKQGETQKVEIETGENLLNDLAFFVENDFLVLQNNNGCNFLRAYGRTLVTVTSPNITFIRNASSFDISSEGTLSYPELTLWSNTNPVNQGISISNANKSGAFNLDIDSENFVISANGSSRFTISGTAEMAIFSFSDEFPQLEAENLLVNELTVAHTGAANMVVHPVNSIKGVIKATGNVIAVNEPPAIDVEVLFTGRLIFQD